MNRFCILESESLLSALQQLNDLHSMSMTLFVVNEYNQMVGTLTDGDLRRAFAIGKQLSTSVKEAMHTSFAYLEDGNDIKTLKELREKKIYLIPILDKGKRIVDVLDMSKRKSNLPITAVLMAGGKGERLRPLTLSIPKPLLKIGNKAIIDRNIERLIEFGIEKISVTVNYLKEQLISHFSEPIKNNVKIDCIAEQQFLGTIGSLKLIKEFRNDTILVMNSDLLTDIDYEDFYLHFQEHEAMMSAAAIPYTISIPYGIFNLDGRNIKNVAEKPVFNYYANAGIYLLKKSALKYIPDNKVFNATDLIESLVREKQRVIRYPLTGLWIDIGTPEEYRKAQDLMNHLQ